MDRHTEEGKEAHNDFVRVLVETGVAGLVFFVWAMARLAIEVVRVVRKRATPLRSAVRVAFAGTMVAYLLMSLTSNLISQPAVQWYFWSIMALAIYPTDPTDAEAVTEDDANEVDRTRAARGLVRAGAKT